MKTTEFKSKQLRSQLYYILRENDNLKDEVKSLRTTITSQSTKGSLNGEVFRLTKELQQVIHERDEAQKNVLLTRQLCGYFKFKEHWSLT